MKITENASPRDRWPLARVLILILAGGFPGLMVDIRVEHVDAVREYSVAWLPIIYCGLMTVACSVALRLWNRTARLIMLPLFVMAFVIGGLGFYFHNQGDVKKVIATSIHAWTDPHMNHSDGPPQVAPLAFAGLGAIGILASLKRFNE
jgi:predicted membrane metal-binding protein